MNDISSFVGSFWTASFTRFNAFVVAESSLSLDDGLRLFSQEQRILCPCHYHPLSTERSLGEGEAEGSSAKLG